MTFWLNNFLYRKSLSLTSASEVTDYQVCLTINRSAGTDSGFTVYVGTACASDYSDIRFTDDHGNNCYYWIESSSSSTATVWVKLPVIHTSGTSLYLYYGGKVPMVSMSNGDKTFPFFDDFLGSAIDTTKWTSSGSVSVAASVATLKFLTATDAILNSISTFGYEYAARFVRATLVLGSGADTYYNNLHFAVSGGTGGNFLYGNYPTKNSFGANVQELGGTWRTSDIGATYTGSHIWDILRASASTVFKIDGSTVRTDSTYIPSGNHTVGAYAGSGVTTGITIDAILVRKYAASEPAAGTWTEESAPTVTQTPLRRVRFMRQGRV